MIGSTSNILGQQGQSFSTKASLLLETRKGNNLVVEQQIQTKEITSDEITSDEITSNEINAVQGALMVNAPQLAVGVNNFYTDRVWRTGSQDWSWVAEIPPSGIGQTINVDDIKLNYSLWNERQQIIKKETIYYPTITRQTLNNLSTFYDFMETKLLEMHHVLDKLASDGIISFPNSSGIASRIESEFCHRTLDRSEWIKALYMGNIEVSSILLNSVELLNPDMFNFKDEDEYDISEEKIHTLLFGGEIPNDTDYDIKTIHEAYVQFVKKWQQDIRISVKTLGFPVKYDNKTIFHEDFNLNEMLKISRPKDTTAESDMNWIFDNIDDSFAAVQIGNKFLDSNTASADKELIKVEHYSSTIKKWAYTGIDEVISNLVHIKQTLFSGNQLHNDFKVCCSSTFVFFQENLSTIKSIRRKFKLIKDIDKHDGLFSPKEIDLRDKYMQELAINSINQQDTLKEDTIKYTGIAVLKAVKDHIEQGTLIDGFYANFIQNFLPGHYIVSKKSISDLNRTILNIDKDGNEIIPDGKLTLLQEIQNTIAAETKRGSSLKLENQKNKENSGSNNTISIFSWNNI